MNKKILVTATVALMMALVVPGTAASAAGETTRTAPYDLGCLTTDMSSSACVSSDEARDGTLRGARIPIPWVNYPFPTVAGVDLTSAAGIYVNVAEESSVTFSAMVRRAAPADATTMRVNACVAVVEPGSELRFRGFGCTPISQYGDATEVTTASDLDWGRMRFQPGEYSFWIYLRGDGTFGNFGEIQVETMSYSTQSTDTTPPTDGETSPIKLEATGYKEKGLQRVDLSWTGASAATVDIYRNATLIATDANDGSYKDNIDQRGSGTYSYKLCDAATTKCSNEATVQF